MIRRHNSCPASCPYQPGCYFFPWWWNQHSLYLPQGHYFLTSALSLFHHLCLHIFSMWDSLLWAVHVVEPCVNTWTEMAGSSLKILWSVTVRNCPLLVWVSSGQLSCYSSAEYLGNPTKQETFFKRGNWSRLRYKTTQHSSSRQLLITPKIKQVGQAERHKQESPKQCTTVRCQTHSFFVRSCQSKGKLPQTAMKMYYLFVCVFFFFFFFSSPLFFERSKHEICVA